MSAESQRPSTPELVDLHPKPADIRRDVLDGLSRPERALPCIYFYDEAGSKLFDRITELPEYYPTRTELAIFDEHLPEMARRLGPRCEVVEYGSGSGEKTEHLLAALDDPVAYVPVEISRGHLLQSARELQERHPELEVLPVCGDFTEPFPLPRPQREPERSVVFFPGSTIGNFDPDAARRLLQHSAKTVGEGGAMLLGTDLQKDVAVLEAAYDDASGVTAAFNLNLLRRINRELGANFDISGFRHVAAYDADRGRIAMFLESRRAQTVQVGDREFTFVPGERIHTESSHKYTLDALPKLAASGGWAVEKVWTDPQQWFAVWLLVTNPGADGGS